MLEGQCFTDEIKKEHLDTTGMSERIMVTLRRLRRNTLKVPSKLEVVTL